MISSERYVKITELAIELSRNYKELIPESLGRITEQSMYSLSHVVRFGNFCVSSIQERASLDVVFTEVGALSHPQNKHLVSGIWVEDGKSFRVLIDKKAIMEEVPAPNVSSTVNKLILKHAGSIILHPEVIALPKQSYLAPPLHPLQEAEAWSFVFAILALSIGERAQSETLMNNMIWKYV